VPDNLLRGFRPLVVVLVIQVLEMLAPVIQVLEIQVIQVPSHSVDRVVEIPNKTLDAIHAQNLIRNWLHSRKA
jgi:hypothetical protein